MADLTELNFPQPPRGFKTGVILRIQDIIEAVEVDSAAFGGEGEDVFTLATISKIGVLVGVWSKSEDTLAAVQELVPTLSKYMFVHGTVVRPKYQGRGLGSYLNCDVLDGIVEHFGLAGVARTVSPANGPNLHILLNKLGYRAVKFILDCYGMGEHRLWLEKPLGYVVPQEHSEQRYGQQLAQGSIPILTEEPERLPPRFGVVSDHYEMMKHLNRGYAVVAQVRPRFVESGGTCNYLVLRQFETWQICA